MGLTLGMWSISGLAHAECAKDLDCEAELICEEGQCVPAPTAVASPAPASAVTSSAPVSVAPASAAKPPERAALVAEAPGPRPVAMRMKSPGLLAGGVVLVTVGVAGMFFGLGGSSCNDLVNSQDDGNCRAAQGGRTTVMLVGLGLIVGGVPLIVIGSRREPVAMVSLAPWVSHQHGGLRVQLHL